MSLVFIHLSDSHLGADEEFRLQDVRVVDRVNAVAKAVRELPFRPDFILHSGDVSNQSELGAQGAYEIAKRIFGAFDVPVYYLTGNHDDRDALRSTLKFPEVEWLDTPGKRLDYRFRAKDFSILALDARQSESAEGDLLAEQLGHLRNIIAEKKKFLLFIHYLAFDIGVPWYLGFQGPEGKDRMIIKNGMEMHKLLAGAGGLCWGVFFGHVHATHTVFRDGVLYSSVRACSVNIGAWPGLSEVIFQPEVPAGFHVVQVGDFGTVVTPHTVAV